MTFKKQQRCRLIIFFPRQQPCTRLQKHLITKEKKEKEKNPFVFHVAEAQRHDLGH